MFRLLEYRAVDIRYFCNFAMMRGSTMIVERCSYEQEPYELVRPASKIEIKNKVDLVVAGILLNDVCSIDLTKSRCPLDVVSVGSKVEILTKGRIITDNVKGYPERYGNAYLGKDGSIKTKGPRKYIIGRFYAAKNRSGEAIIEIDI